MTAPVPAAPPVRRKLTTFLLTGLAVLLPLFLTGYIVFLIYHFVDTNLGKWLAYGLALLLRMEEPNAPIRLAGTVLGVVAALVIAVSAGALTASYLGRRFIAGVQRLILKVPIVRVIYPYVKQVTDFFLAKKTLGFRTAVAIPYPRKGVYSLGFVTGEGLRSLTEATGEAMVHIFIPSSPTPVTGYVVFVPRRDVIELPLTVDEVLRFCISGGVVVPPRELTHPEAEAPSEGQELPAGHPAWAAEK